MTADLPRYPGPHKGLTAAARVVLSNSEQRWVLRWGCTLSMRGRITRDGWYGVSDVDLLILPS